MMKPCASSESWDRTSHSNQHWASIQGFSAQDISIPAEAWQNAIEKAATDHLKWCDDLENTAATFINILVGSRHILGSHAYTDSIAIQGIQAKQRS